MLLDHPSLLLLGPALAGVFDPLVDGLLDDLLRLVGGLDGHGVLLLLAVVGQGPDGDPDVAALQLPDHARRQVRRVLDLRRELVQRLRFALPGVPLLQPERKSGLVQVLVIPELSPSLQLPSN